MKMYASTLIIYFHTYPSFIKSSIILINFRDRTSSSDLKERMGKLIIKVKSSPCTVPANFYFPLKFPKTILFSFYFLPNLISFLLAKLLAELRSAGLSYTYPYTAALL